MPRRNPTQILSENLFPVVGVGASAGGLEAFKEFVKAIPEVSGMAYILIQHLAPDHESFLADILQKATKLPVVEISDHIKVLPDHIYVIPANKILTADDGVLLLEPRVLGEKSNTIDIFFTSLAE
ncbi:MAG: chemotaxis protein CheB, partial [Flavitalea sp.]